MKLHENITVRRAREERKKERTHSIQKSRRLAMKEKRMRRSTIGEALGLSSGKTGMDGIGDNLAEQAGAAAAALYDKHSKSAEKKGRRSGERRERVSNTYWLILLWIWRRSERSGRT